MPKQLLGHASTGKGNGSLPRRQMRRRAALLLVLAVLLGVTLVTTVSRVFALAGGRDILDTSLTDLTVNLLPNEGCPWSPLRTTCTSLPNEPLKGPTIIQRQQAVVENNQLVIHTEVVSIQAKGHVKCTGVPGYLQIAIGNNPAKTSPGMITTNSFYAGPPTAGYLSPPSPLGCGVLEETPCHLAAPAHSFFDIFVAVAVHDGLSASLFSQDAIRMEADIDYLPPLEEQGFSGYSGGGWVEASQAGNPDATPHAIGTEPLKLYYDGGNGPKYCADLVGHPQHTPTAYTAIALASYTATEHDGVVLITWTTGAEIDSAGFNLLRSTGGPYVRLNDALIPATGSPASGASYVYTDTNVVKGVTYHYMLEDVDLHGASTLHGPLSVRLTPYSLYLPLALGGVMMVGLVGMWLRRR